MYALYKSPEVLMNVSWPCGRGVEDVTRALALKSDLPLERGVKVSRRCGSIDVMVTNVKGRKVHLHEGESVDFRADGRDGHYDAPTGHVVVDGAPYSGYILMDEDGDLSDLLYDDPEVHATAMGLRLEVMPMGE